MPRIVDREQRRRDILHATVQVLATGGISGLSFRAIAEKLGGSTTMVTHYFPSQAELLDGLAHGLLEEWETEVAEMEVGAETAVDRLLVLLNWLVPQSEVGLQEERARFVLLGEGLLGDDIQSVFASWDSRIRDMLRRHLDGLVPPEDLELRADVLRSITNGLTMSVFEHPKSWDTARIQAVLRRVLADMGLQPHSGAQQSPVTR